MSSPTIMRLGCGIATPIFTALGSFPLLRTPYTPPAPFSDLLALHQRLGIEHGVLVQAAPYGTDHSAILAAIAESGGHYRGVGLIDETTTDEQLQVLHDGGLRGIRFNLMGHLPGARDPQSCDNWPNVLLHLDGMCWFTENYTLCCRSWTSGRT